MENRTIYRAEMKCDSCGCSHELIEMQMDIGRRAYILELCCIGCGKTIFFVLTDEQFDNMAGKKPSSIN